MTDRILISDLELHERVDALDPLRPLREAANGERLYLVGGAVRDLLLGLEAPDDLDIAVDGELEALLAKLGTAALIHERFGTASIQVSDTRIDLARTRTESYARPGALPEVAPAGIEPDLARRDFTINAIAVPLEAGREVIDPGSGRSDLRNGLIRVLHPGSFRDDPTRMLRAARYCARLGFALDPDTMDLIPTADLDLVSADRVHADLARLADEPAAEEGFALLARWGLAGVDEGAPERIKAALTILADAEWAGIASRRDVVLSAALPDPGVEARILRLASARPERPSEAVRLARGRAGSDLVLARAAGSAWLDRWVNEWRKVNLEITGADLIAAGIPEGPAIGRGLDAALVAKLDGTVAGRDQELQVALSATAAS